jgi:hypothetical protein
MGQPLFTNNVGISNYQVTRSYDFDDVPTRISDFPATAKAYPNFNVHQPAFVGIISHHTVRRVTRGDPPATASQKKRKQDEEVAFNEIEVTVASIQWIYFDCRILTDFSIVNREAISTQFNQA